MKLPDVRGKMPDASCLMPVDSGLLCIFCDVVYSENDLLGQISRRLAAKKASASVQLQFGKEIA